jgi:hypothetical protein
MPHEVSARRLHFRPGPSIRLADGQWWTFPAPPGRDASGVAGFGPDYVAAVAAIGEAEDEAERFRAELALAICLLCRNYDLDPDALCDLLGYRPGDPALAATQAAFRRVAQEHARSSRSSADVVAPGGVPGHAIPATPRFGSRSKWVASSGSHPSLGRMVSWFRSLLGRFFDPPASSMRR